MVAGEYINEAQIPAIAITNTNPLVTSNNDYYFRVCYRRLQSGGYIGQVCVGSKKETTAGVLLP